MMSSWPLFFCLNLFDAHFLFALGFGFVEDHFADPDVFWGNLYELIVPNILEGVLKLHNVWGIEMFSTALAF